MNAYTIYRSFKAGRDEPVAEIESSSAAAALEEFARNADIGDYSLDQASAGRLVLCPPMMRQHYYTYIEDASAV